MRKLTYLPMPGSVKPFLTAQSNKKTERKFAESKPLSGKKIDGNLNEEGKKSFSSFIKNVKTDSHSQDASVKNTKNNGNVIDLFKSSQHVVAREQKQIVLKLKNK